MIYLYHILLIEAYSYDKIFKTFSVPNECTNLVKDMIFFKQTVRGHFYKKVNKVVLIIWAYNNL